MRELRSLTAVAPGILFVEGPASNWTVFHGRSHVELVDCGYPADRPLVEESIRSTGLDASALRRIIVTHGHSDHLGAARDFSEGSGVEVLAAESELPNVRREITEQVTVADLLPVALRRGTIPWAVAAIRAGGLGDVGVPSAQAIVGEAIELSTGHRLEVVPTPGHTTGHACFFEPDAEVLITGDALVTGHALLADAGELQRLPTFFHHDAAGAEASARRLSLCDARWVLPGHGPALRL
ncbi:MBL fold metallo-hydrolase [Leifsonia sp. NPDC056824]|uniref:MBL fold metallo-hydrolase n=1 Tax=Leifsonia sp. NPDC056824 TaxID=3345953 RepID=UPI0036AA872D